MISIMEHMVKKTPLTKHNDNKKGMTLVEVMAAMAILSILFVGISSFIVSITKSEVKSNTYLENTTVVKSILVVFDVNGDGSGNGEFMSNERFEELKNRCDAAVDGSININFNDISNMQRQLIYNDESDGNDYTAQISINRETKVESGVELDSHIYSIKVRVTNNHRNDSLEKEVYTFRKI